MTINILLKNTLLNTLLAQMPTAMLWLFDDEKLLSKIPLAHAKIDNGKLVFGGESVQVLQTGTPKIANVMQDDVVMIGELIVGEHLTLDSEQVFGGGLINISNFEIAL